LERTFRRHLRRIPSDKDDGDAKKTTPVIGMKIPNLQERL